MTEKDLNQKPLTVTVTPELCECGRLYKDSRDKTGKFMCGACYMNLGIEDLKKLWGSPMPNEIKQIFSPKTKETK